MESQIENNFGNPSEFHRPENTIKSLEIRKSYKNFGREGIHASVSKTSTKRWNEQITNRDFDQKQERKRFHTVISISLIKRDNEPIRNMSFV
jgi:hypothetical protein